MDYSVKREELYAYIYTENILGHALILWLRILNSFFFLFFFLFLFFLVLFFSLFPFLRIIYYGFFTISSIHVWVRCWRSFFFPLLLPFLESSILSCKVACSLFRHHLHINAARGLAGQHLMRRQQYPQIFVFFSLLSFIWYFLIHFVARFIRGVTLRDW